MGSYASEPKVDKESLDENDDRLNCGASSMQGWRVTQEDAHNCLLDYDTHTSFFAVYDGHGGHEVAQYCSQKLPEFIKTTEEYLKGDIEGALINGFLGFDETITKPEVIETLKEIAGVADEDDSEDEENVDHLYEEATMPIEKVIEKYTSNLLNPAIKSLKKKDKAPSSPFLKARREDDTDKPGSSTDGQSSSVSSSSKSSDNAENSTKSEENNEAEAKVKEESNVTNDKISEDKKPIPEILVTNSDDKKLEDSKELANNVESTKEIVKNGEKETKPLENGDVSPTKGKGKAKRITPQTITDTVSTRPRRTTNQTFKSILEMEDSEEETEDEEDKTFEGPQEISSDDEDDSVNNSHLNDTSESSEEESEEDEDENDGLEEEEENDLDIDFTRNMKEEPGSDSGCTAVVALLKGDKLYVANAGDSRCVVCRDGKAIEMSFDHKPEDQPEHDRIVKAGGRVTPDGRVNNGLNLSRAIGDHAYKQNKELSAKEQMITALPDIKTLDIDVKQDDFMILACDGIWNFMSSQEVVDFVKERLDAKVEKMSKICEELFDHCLAPNTKGDGTGCDNMTAIIVQFKSNRKRPSSEVNVETSKKAKTEETLIESSTT